MLYISLVAREMINNNKESCNFNPLWFTIILPNSTSNKSLTIVAILAKKKQKTEHLDLQQKRELCSSLWTFCYFCSASKAWSAVKLTWIQAQSLFYVKEERVTLSQPPLRSAGGEPSLRRFWLKYLFSFCCICVKDGWAKTMSHKSVKRKRST